MAREEVIARTCDECGSTTAATVTTTLYASDFATEEWHCDCGQYHHIDITEGEDH